MKKINNDKITQSPLFGLNPDTVCGTECAGLIPSAPENADELRSYSDIQNYTAKPNK